MNPFLHLRKWDPEKSNGFAKVTKYTVEPECKSRSADPKARALKGHPVLPWANNLLGLLGVPGCTWKEARILN